MFFTQEDYRKIEDYLKRKSIKDTQFDEAITPLDGEEEIAFVQNGKNVKAHVKDIVEQLFLLGVSDFVNITDKYNQSYINLKEAIALIPFLSRKKGQVITFINKEGDWVIYQFKGYNTLQWNNTTLWVNLFESIYINSILPDEEDLTKTDKDKQGNVRLKFKDKVYDPENFSGLGRVYLRKNIMEEKNVLLQEMISKSNTIYYIQYDYDLNGETITIPEGCILQFQGGSISNGSIVFNNTIISSAQENCLNINIKGTLYNDELIVDWFGECNENVDCSIPIQKVVNYLKSNSGGKVKFLNKSYRLDTPIDVTATRYIEFVGMGDRTKLLANTGAAVFDLSGSNTCRFSGIYITNEFEASNSSTIGILSQPTKANTVSKEPLHNSLYNVRIVLRSMPKANRCNVSNRIGEEWYLGTIGLYWQGSEESTIHNTSIYANTPVVFTSKKGVFINNPSTFVEDDNVWDEHSTGMNTFSGECSIVKFNKISYNMVLNGINSFNAQSAYMGCMNFALEDSTIGDNEYAIYMSESVQNSKFLGTYEGNKGILTLASNCYLHNSEFNFVFSGLTSEFPIIRHKFNKNGTNFYPWIEHCSFNFMNGLGPLPIWNNKISIKLFEDINETCLYNWINDCTFFLSAAKITNFLPIPNKICTIANNIKILLLDSVIEYNKNNIKIIPKIVTDFKYSKGYKNILFKFKIQNNNSNSIQPYRINIKGTLSNSSLTNMNIVKPIDIDFIMYKYYDDNAFKFTTLIKDFPLLYTIYEGLFIFNLIANVEFDKDTNEVSCTLQFSKNGDHTDTISLLGKTINIDYLDNKSFTINSI